MMRMKFFNVTLRLVGFLLFILIIFDIINAQEATTDAPPNIVTLPGPNVEGIPKTNSDYSKLLAYSLYFYEAQRSGVLPKTNRVPWRHSSALTDGFKEGVDLTGGYYDAGDYMKFTLPLSWTLTMISWGGIEWYEGYELSGQTQYLFDMIKWGTDWLIKSHSLETNELYVQVGTDEIDHNYWGTDSNIPLPRAAFKIGGNKHGTDIAAEVVAAFASSSILFREKYLELEYSNELLLHAKILFEFAELKEWELYSKSVPQAKQLYGPLRYQDKLVWASLWLYKATGDVIYLDKARNYFNTFLMKGTTQIINWADKTCATYFLFVQATNGTNSLEELTWKFEAERYLDVMINPSLLPNNRCTYTLGGLLWCNGDSDFGSLNVPINIAFVSLFYAPYATTIEKSKKYKNFAQSQIMYVLGENPMKIPYVVGVNAKSPKNPHHAGAHGSTTNDILQPVYTTNIIYGAVVGGPNKTDFFIDDRTLYNYTEVTLDYNALWQGLMAYQVIKYKMYNASNVANNTSSKEPIQPASIPPTIPPPSDIPPENNETNNTGNGINLSKTGKIIIITVGSVLGGLFLILGGLFVWKNEWFNKKREKLSSDNSNNANLNP